MSHSDARVSVLLLRLAEREFPRLMGHSTNREDALQTLALVQFATRGVDAVEASRKMLAWLEYELGIGEKPSFPEPTFPPADVVAEGSFIDELDQAIEIERAAA